jgi:hypothetical protein
MTDELAVATHCAVGSTGGLVRVIMDYSTSTHNLGCGGASSGVFVRCRTDLQSDRPGYVNSSISMLRLGVQGPSSYLNDCVRFKWGPLQVHIGRLCCAGRASGARAGRFAGLGGCSGWRSFGSRGWPIRTRGRSWRRCHNAIMLYYLCRRV